MNFRDFLFATAIFFTLVILWTIVENAPVMGAEQPDINPANSVFVDGELTEHAALQAGKQLMDASTRINHHKPIYLIINTKGGSLAAGNMLAIAAEMVPNPVHTVSCFAAGTGFNLVQRLGVRYVGKYGVMAALKPTGGIYGDDKLSDVYKTLHDQMLLQVDETFKANAKRMGIDVDKYGKLIENELWLAGDEAVKRGAADAVVDQSVCEMEKK